jgi:predicted exporter
LLTLVFGASLIGVAQDYGIYFLCNRLGADRALDSVSLLRRLMPGLLLTLVAAVIGYMGLALTPFPGLRHMAVFSALGLIFAWLTVLAWFPLMVSAGSLRSGAFGARYATSIARWPRLGWNKASMIALSLVALLVAAGWSRLGVNDDIRSLQTPPPHLVADQIKLSRLLDAPTPVQYFLVRGSDGEQVLQREEALKHRLDPLVAAHRLTGYQAISNWVPSARAQAARRTLVGEKLLTDTGPLDLVARQIGEDAAWVTATRAHLQGFGGAMTPEQFLAAPAGEPWRHLWLGQQGDSHASIVALRGLNRAGLEQLRHAGDGIEGVQWVDKISEISSVLGRYRMVMAWVVAGAYLLVFGLLLPRYGRNAWRALAPTALASLITVAAFGLAGQPLQLFHVLALMLLLGVGVDYGIFMQESSGKDGATPWLAIGLSAANTILSFGLLGLSRTPALQAFGLTMLAGTALVWLIVPCFAQTKEQTNG